MHIIGDITFFTLIWPRDLGRPLVWQQGPDLWFWIHVGQLLLFGALSLVAFRRLARLTRDPTLTPSRKARGNPLQT